MLMISWLCGNINLARCAPPCLRPRWQVYVSGALQRLQLMGSYSNNEATSGDGVCEYETVMTSDHAA